MKRKRDHIKSKVYLGENRTRMYIGGNTQLKHADIEKWQEYANALYNRWHDEHPNSIFYRNPNPIVIKWGRFNTMSGSYNANTHTIKMSKYWLSDPGPNYNRDSWDQHSVVLHELAHAITCQWDGLASHSNEFIMVHLDLIRMEFGDSIANGLAKDYKQAGALTDGQIVSINKFSDDTTASIVPDPIHRKFSE
jgi:hypothetical protein